MLPLIYNVGYFVFELTVGYKPTRNDSKLDVASLAMFIHVYNYLSPKKEGVCKLFSCHVTKGLGVVLEVHQFLFSCIGLVG